ncbi:MAG: hypothetical protein IKW66_03115 [Clostridia bacterium]|nr:hypothetical protein [Clostridia bacterium]
MRKWHVVLCIVGAGLLLLGAALLLVGQVAVDQALLLGVRSYLKKTIRVCLLLGGGLILGNAPYVIFKRLTARGCTMATSLMSLGFSALGGLGLYCALTYVFTTPRRNPIAHPASLLVGILALFAFILLIAFYVCKRREKCTFMGLCMDGWSAIVHLLPCFLGFSYLHEIISWVLRHL